MCSSVAFSIYTGMNATADVVMMIVMFVGCLWVVCVGSE